MDTGCRHAVVWVGAVGTVLERRGALGIKANTRKTLIVGGTGLTVRNVPHSRRRRAFSKETESRFAVFSVDAVFSLRELGAALGKDADKILRSTWIGVSAPLVDLARTAETLNTACGHTVVWVGAVGTVLERRGALHIEANAGKTLVIGGASLAVRNVPHSGGGRAFVEETKSGFAVCGVHAVLSLGELGATPGIDTNEVLGGTGIIGGAVLTVRSRTTKPFDAGQGFTVGGVVAVEPVHERRRALAVDANAGEALVVPLAVLAVGNVPLPGRRRALLEEAESGLAVFGVGAVLSLGELRPATAV